VRAGVMFAGQVAFVAVVGVLALAPTLVPQATARQVRERLLGELQPIALANCVMTRVGSPYDGGYLMCANLLDRVQVAYSYGIGPADDWGCEISQAHAVPVHQYDCFNPPASACESGRSVFHDECIGARAETIDARPFDTLTRQIARNGDAGKTLAVKIDVEGAEVESIMATSDRVLSRIDQLAMEIHGADRRYLELVRKLKRTFHLVHLHYNNQACSPRYRPLPAWAYQVLFVNKRIAVVDPRRPKPVLPHPLDAPDYSIDRDCQVPEAVRPAM
jgi:hypothetical protein